MPHITCQSRGNQEALQARFRPRCEFPLTELTASEFVFQINAEMVVVLDYPVERDDEWNLKRGSIIGALFEFPCFLRIRLGMIELLHDLMDIFTARVPMVAKTNQ